MTETPMTTEQYGALVEVWQAAAREWEIRAWLALGLSALVTIFMVVSVLT